MTRHQIEPFSNGSFSVRNLELNECMHSSIGPWTEAQLIYLEQSQVLNRITETFTAPNPQTRPFVIYDVGLGIAANSLAVLELLTETKSQEILGLEPKVILMSFETDLEGIKNATQHPELFPFLTRNSATISYLLEHRSWSRQLASGIELHWELKIGDFRSHLAQCLPADLIFFDLYSPKSCPDLWGLQTFRSLSQKTYPPELSEGRETQLITYTASTAVRAALMLSGFYVGRGVSTPGKKETTLASTRLSSLQESLSQSWIEHWQRSSKPLPPDYLGPLTEADRELILSKIKNSSKI
jgi:queuine tRNA-ribosyltransferase